MKVNILTFIIAIRRLRGKDRMYTFFILGEVFRLEDEHWEDPLPLTCRYFHDIKKAKWSWTNPFTNEVYQSLPFCEARCQNNPPLREKIIRSNWTRVSYNRNR